MWKNPPGWNWTTQVLISVWLLTDPLLTRGTHQCLWAWRFFFFLNWRYTNTVYFETMKHNTNLLRLYICFKLEESIFLSILVRKGFCFFFVFCFFVRRYVFCFVLLCNLLPIRTASHLPRKLRLEFWIFDYLPTLVYVVLSQQLSLCALH